jgi:signal transduction histidine kinase
MAFTPPEDSENMQAELLAENAGLRAQLATVKATQNNPLKSIFFVTIHHELRTLISLILGPAELLLQQTSLTQDVRQVLEMVTRNALLLLKLVNDLQEISHLELGQLKLHYATCDLSQLVSLLAANFNTVAEKRQITYCVQIPPPLWVEVDPARIERVVLKLLSNAFKFTPDGGSIICSLTTEDHPSQRAAVTSTQVQLTVQDSGPGVPIELCEMIFEHFRQTEEGAKRHVGGTGLGLAIVKGLVSLHGGTIQVDEAPGGGARFTVRLPQRAHTGTPIQSEEDPAPSKPTAAHMSQGVAKELLPARPSFSSAMSEQSLILIVEDHPQMRQFLSAQLSSQYRVMEAANGQEGLTLAQQVHPDLILTDIMMPVMSGNEMLAALRADSSCDDITVVVLSAGGSEDLRLNLLREGAQDYLIKPFSPEELQVRLGNLLTLQRTRRLLQEELNSSQQNIENLVRVLTTNRRNLEAMNSELRGMNKQQSNFIAVVSHEFRTALSGIQGFSELLSEQEWSPQEVKEYATDITTDARRLSHLINEVLDLERMKSGKTTLLREPVDVNALLRKLGEQTQHMAAKHTLLYHLDDALPLIQGDQDQLIQVVGNVLSNALKYSPAGGNILLSSQREQESIHVSIQDQGIGIAEEALKNIFEPYSRIDLEKTRFIGGTGLGLSLVREIINLHGGTIWVESTIGDGSTFHFFLPLISAVSGASSEHGTSSNI